MAIPVLISGGDSADPKKILLDLQQLAAVCQRLGIDLQKTAALGQSVSTGKGGGGGGPLSTQNQSHSPYYQGGGTGYTNLGLGGLVGQISRPAAPGIPPTPSVFAPGKESVAFGFKVTNKDLYQSIGTGEITGTGYTTLEGAGQGGSDIKVPYGGGRARTHRGEVYRLSASRKQLKGWAKYGEFWKETTYDDNSLFMDQSGKLSMGKQSFSHSTMLSVSQAYKLQGPSMAYNVGYGYGMGLNARSNFLDILKNKEEKRILKFLIGIEGARALINLTTKKINYDAGETFWTNAAREATQVAIAGGMVAVGSYINSVAAPAVKQAFVGAYGRAVGGGLSRAIPGTIAAGSAAVVSATPIALVAASAFVLTKAIDLQEEDNASRALLQQIKATTTGSMHQKVKVRPRVSPDAEYAFNENVDKMQALYYIDPESGERKERSGWSKWWYNRLFVRLWGRDADAKAEKEWRMKEVGKLHEAAQEKSRILDWVGARKDVARARELVVVEEVMPFFWKEPEKYLRAMEASRIAGRNWARAQQPRGGSRTGD